MIVSLNIYFQKNSSNLIDSLEPKYKSKAKVKSGETIDKILKYSIEKDEITKIKNSLKKQLI